MVERLAPLFQNAHAAACIRSGRAEHRQELAFADVERTGAGDQNAAGTKHLQRAQVELLVAAEGGGHGALGLGERRRVENDGVILPARGGVVLEQVECIGLGPFDLAAAVRGAIELLVPLRHFQCRTRRVHRGNGCAYSRQVQRKSSLIGETVERVSVSVALRGSVVLALMEEGASLLPAESIEVEADRVHGEDGAGALAAHQLRLARRQLLQFANVRIDALDDAGLGKVFGDGVEDRLPQVLAIESLGERLQGKHIVVLVEDDAGQQVGLAEDHAIGIGVARDLCAKANCGGNALPQERCELRFADFVASQEADRNLRCTAVERRSQMAAALIADMHQRSSSSLGGRHEIGAIDPQVSASQARRAALVHGYLRSGNEIGQGILPEIKDLSYAGGPLLSRIGFSRKLNVNYILHIVCLVLHYVCQILLLRRMLWICLIKKKAFWDHCWPSEWSLDTTSRPSCVISAGPSSMAPAFQLAVWCSRWLLSS